MGKTISEKILAKNAGKKEVNPGEYIQATNTSRFVATGGLRASEFKKIFGQKPPSVYDPKKIAIVLADHPGVSGWQYGRQVYLKEGRDFAKLLGIPKSNIFDLGRGGIGHQISIDNAWGLPGTVYLSQCNGHAYTPGALGCFALPLSYGSTAFLITGKTWLLVPETAKVELTGELEEGVMSRDVSEWLINQVSPTGNLFMAQEFTGPVIDDMSIDGRLVLTCLGVNTGAMTSIINPDKKTIDYVKERTTDPFEPIVSDDDATYAKQYKLDVSDLEPQVVVPPERNTVKSISEVKETKIDRGFIGSCASGRIEDLRIAAKILKGRKIHPDVRLTITPGSVNILKQALKEGLMDIFVDAEVTNTYPACGQCYGGYTPVDKDEVCVSSSTNNVPGRQGHMEAHVYLASPATVAASSVSGKLADPRDYL
ncbi:MAG: aconitase family protein [Candidatus Hodarchaeota archaeon]